MYEKPTMLSSSTVIVTPPYTIVNFWPSSSSFFRALVYTSFPLIHPHPALIYWGPKNFAVILLSHVFQHLQTGFLHPPCPSSPIIIYVVKHYLDNYAPDFSNSVSFRQNPLFLISLLPPHWSFPLIPCLDFRGHLRFGFPFLRACSFLRLFSFLRSSSFVRWSSLFWLPSIMRT